MNPTGGTEGTAWIGWSPSGDPITAFNGIIDDIRVYNRTKSDSEVMEMYLEDGGLVSVTGGSTQFPTEFSLLQNYPNPFNPSTTIRFSLPTTEHVKISIYDVLGELVGTALDEERSAGTYYITYTPDNLATGSYFYRLQAGSFVAIRKLLPVR